MKHLRLFVVLGVFLVSCLLISTTAFGQEDFFELVKTGSLEEVRRAIESGAKVEARDGTFGRTPLMKAASWNENPEVVRVLLEAGAEVNSRDERLGGGTPLIWVAIHNDNPEVIRVLLDGGADGKVRCNSGKTAFDYAKDDEHIRNTEVYWLLNEAQY